MFDFHRYPKYQIVMVSSLGNKSGVTPTFSVAPLPMHDRTVRRSDVRSLTFHISKMISQFKTRCTADAVERPRLVLFETVFAHGWWGKIPKRGI
jgi:hypothetical protein